MLKFTQLVNYRAEIHIQAHPYPKAFFPPTSCFSRGDTLQNGTLDPENKVPDPVEELPQLGKERLNKRTESKSMDYFYPQNPISLQPPLFFLLISEGQEADTGFIVI